MSSIEQLLQQRINFQQAAAQNPTDPRYQEALRFNAQQLASKGYNISNANKVLDPSKPLQPSGVKYELTPTEQAPPQQTPNRLTGVLQNSFLRGGSELPLVNPITNKAPILDTAAKRSAALSVVTIAVAPGLGLASTPARALGVAAANQAAGVGISAGIKYATGGGLITPSEALESAALSGVTLIAAQPIAVGASKLISYATPKINNLAESALARSSQIYTKATNRIQPGLGQASLTVIKQDATRLGNVLDAKELGLKNVVSSKVFDPLAGVGNTFKSEAVTVGQRVIDVVMPGRTYPAMPSLKQYAAAGRVSLETSQTLSDFKLATYEPVRDAVKGFTGNSELYNLKALSFETPKIKITKPSALTEFKAVLQINKIPSKKVTETFVKVPKKVNVSGVTSTKNISNFDALKMAKGVSKQGKRLTQIMPYPETAMPKASQITRSIAKETAALTGKSKASAGLLSGGMPKGLTQPYPGTTKQRSRTYEETVYLTKPSDILGLKDRSLPSSAGLTGLSDEIGLGSRNKFTPAVTPIDITDITQPMPQQPEPQPITIDIVTQVTGQAQKTKQSLKMPQGFQMDKQDFGFSSKRGRGYSGRQKRVYPIKEAKELLKGIL